MMDRQADEWTEEGQTDKVITIGHLQTMSGGVLKIQWGISPSKLKVGSLFFFSAYCLIVFYIFTFFDEEIFYGVQDTECTLS